MGWKKDTKKAAKSGGSLSNKEAKKIAQRYQGVNKSAVKSFAAGLPSSTTTTTTTTTTNNDTNPSYDYNQQVYSDTGKFPFQWQFEHEIGLANIQGGYSTQVANIQAGATTQAASIRGEADKEVARAYADAQKYGAELGLEGTKYASDKESEWRQAVANIEVQGKLDLQPIINAGLERVTGIEAQAQRDVAETTGKYSLASTKEQTAAQERLGKMELAGSMYGLLGAAFG